MQASGDLREPVSAKRSEAGEKMTDSADLEKLEAEFAAAIADAVDIDTLEAVRVAALGNEGSRLRPDEGVGRDVARGAQRKWGRCSTASRTG